MATPALDGPPVVVAPRPEVASAASTAMQAYYRSVEARLKAGGNLRRDSGAELGVTDRILADTYIRVALNDEYVARGNALVAQETASNLRRWEAPIRMAVEFGPSVPKAQRVSDKALISGFARRLSGIAVHPISMQQSSANFTVFVVSEDERRDLAPRLNQLVPGIDSRAVSAVTAMEPSTFCMVLAFSDGDSPVYTRAVAVIRAEMPASMREMCVHEELAQGMGLANDSALARPSIFNDDEEFALLTPQDEMMLRIHYDPRLRPGMTATEARPIVQTIAAEFFGGTS